MCPEKLVRLLPENAIASLEDMEAPLTRARHSLHCEMEDIAECWENLRRFGGQRADHAAMLLSRLRPALDEIANYARRCSEQITAMVADPFGTKEG